MYTTVARLVLVSFHFFVFCSQIYNVVSICLGSPPQTIEFDCYDKDKKCHKIGPITPLQFYKDLVKPLCNMEDMVKLNNCPILTQSSNVGDKIVESSIL